MKRNMDRNGAEQAFNGANQVRGGAGVSDDQARAGHAMLVLACNPGDVGARQQLIRVRRVMEARLDPSDPAYAVLADITAALDADLLAQINRASPPGLDMGPTSRQDPVMALYRLGTINEAQLRAAREIQQVAELCRVGGVGGVRAMDPAAIRVDGGGQGGGLDLVTYRAGHHATGRVGDFVRGLRSDSQRWGGRSGRSWSVFDIVMAVVVDRFTLREVGRNIIARHGLAGDLVSVKLRAYADDAKGIWEVMDLTRRRGS